MQICEVCIHDKEGNDLIIENMENQLTDLKHEVEEIKKSNMQKLELVRVEAGANSKQLAQLIKTVSDIVERLDIMEEVQTNSTQRYVNEEEPTAETEVNKCDNHGENTASGTKQTAEAHSENQKNMNELEKITAKSTTTKEVKDMNHSNSKNNYFKCPQFEYVCENSVTLNKHTNTKHQGMNSEVNKFNSKCGICEDAFETKNELQTHIQYHIDEIEELDITILTNGHDLFEYILCSFESGLGDSIREHLIDHVNHTTEEKVENAKKAFQPEYKSLLDE